MYHTRHRYADVLNARHVPTLSGNGREDKEERRGSQDAVRDSGNGVRSRSGLEKR
jgi:hypothetical protein